MAPSFDAPTGVIEAGPVLSGLEIAFGQAMGDDDTASVIRVHPDAEHLTPEQALDAALRPALQRGPSLFSFSGGRDSSALLAAATRLARREGYDLPIPATLYFPGDSAADESEWQRHVLDHLGITEQIIIPVTDELDAVGEVATGALRRHGLLWPFNTHMHLPIIARAAGGSVVTGFGGDELGRSSQGARAGQLLGRRRRPHPVDALVLGLAASPPPVRRAVERRRSSAKLAATPWLTPTSRAGIARQRGIDEAKAPIGWGRLLTDWFAVQRYFSVCNESFRVLGASYDVTVTAPLIDRGVLTSLAQLGGIGGLGTRANLMRTLFGEVLPTEILERRSKASFSNPLWGPIAQQFAADWSGGGFDPELVDIEALREHWSHPDIEARSLLLLQVAWVYDNT